MIVMDLMFMSTIITEAAIITMTEVIIMVVLIATAEAEIGRAHV
jgi:hypothetical protein